MSSRSSERAERRSAGLFVSTCPTKSHGPAAKKPVAITACVLFGLRYDTDAERLLRRRVTITVPGNVTAKIEPTDVFKALLDYKLKKRPARKQSPVRSRSPRASPPVMLVLYPPNQITNQEIFAALKELGIPETPTVEQIFRDIPEVGCKQFIKLTFKHMHSLTKLSSTQLTLKGQSVLLLEPALKDNIQKSVLHAIPHHQVVVRTEGPVSPEELRQVMEQYGPIANVDCANDIVVTYTLLKSAKDALRAQNYSNGELNLTFSKKLA